MESLSMSVVCHRRSAGASAVQRAAYRVGEDFTDERTGIKHYYSYRDDVFHKSMIVPSGSPAWSKNPELAWNQAEKSETRKNSVVAREFRIALPGDFHRDQMIASVDEFMAILVSEYGVIATAGLHLPKVFTQAQLEKLSDQPAWPIPGSDLYTNWNYHAHILCSTRELTPTGFGKKTRKLDDKSQGPKEILKLRDLAAQIFNKRAREQGLAWVMQSRSFRRLGIEKVAKIHLGQKGQWAARHDIQFPGQQFNLKVEAIEELLKLAQAPEILPSIQTELKPSCGFPAP